MVWMLLVLFYGVSKGSREFMKKKAMNVNSMMDVLVYYTLLSFIMVLPEVKNAGGMEGRFYGFIAIKSLCIFIAWICSFEAIKKLPISLYGVLDLSRVMFSTFLGVVVLNEVLTINRVIGLILVSVGLLLLKFKPPFMKKWFKLEEETKIKEPENGDTGVKKKGFFVLLAFISCILNAVSGCMDKVLMKDLNPDQLQFWYMLFLLIYYIIYVLARRIKINPSIVKNYWVYILSFLFVIADKALFIANAMPDSQVTVMTLIKQTGVIVTILTGRFFLKEKNVADKFFCAAIIIIGIMIGIM